MELGLIDIFFLLLITVGPLKGMIVFAAVTARGDSAFRRTVAIKAVTTATIVLLVFAVAGEFLLDIFHVSLPALKIAGGLILALFALHMVMGEEKPESADQVPVNPSTDVAIYPIAMPMLATPQGIVAIVTIMAATVTLYDVTKVIVLLLVIMAIDLGVLLTVDRIIRWIGPATLQIIARVARILLLALAVQLVIWALRDLGALAPLPAGGH